MSAETAGASGVEILVAEDSLTQAERLRYLLEQHHYEVAVARDGRAALDWLAQRLPAVVITDINMPRLNGYDLCRQIKADRRLEHIPVILLTSLSDAMDVLEGLACGADSFITKPYSEDYLLARVKQTLADAALPHSRRASIRVEIPVPGQSGVITADPQRMVSLLISTYEAAIYRNTELVQTQEALRTLNEHLEDLVEERTAVLSAEMAEHQRAELKVRYLAGVLENVSDGIISLDLQRNILSWNVGAEHLFGYQTQDVLGHSYADLVAYDYLDSTEAEAFRQIDETGSWRGEVGSHHQDGSLIYVLVAGAVLKDKTGAVSGYSSVLHDITDRKLAEAALAKTAGILSQAENIGRLGSWEWDIPTDRVVWSDGMYDVLGLSASQINPTYGAFLDRLHPDDRERVDELISGTLTSAALIEYETRIVVPNGQARVLSARTMVFNGDDGQPIRQAGVVIDITERKQRERELEAISAISIALRAAETRSQMLPIILEQVVALLKVSGASVAMRDAATDELEIILGSGEMADLTALRLPPGAGIGGQVIITGLPYVSDNLRADPHWYQVDWLSDGRAGVCVPLITSQHVLGVIWATRSAPFTPQVVRVLSAIADIAASAIQRAGLHEQTQERLRRLTALREIDSAIMNSMDLRTTLNIILRHVAEQLRVDACDILLLNRAINVLEYGAGHGFRGRGIEKVRQRLGEGYAGQAALERGIVAVADLRTQPAEFQRAQLLTQEAFVGLLCMPLIAKGQVVGTLEVWSRTPLSPDADWLAYLETLAGQSAIAVSDAWQFADLQRSNQEMYMAYDSTLEGWSAALDLRDKETEGHSQRVTEMTLRLARELGVDDGALEHMRRGALLHDIGKMGVPDAILLKPGPLTDEEWVVMKRHPALAYEMLAPIQHLRPA
ncbi:MAG: GAF domain-containing protein, partial [Anaerolineales bacterium]